MSNEHNEPPTVGMKIRELRLQAGMTQDELAEHLGTTKATVSKMERSVRNPGVNWLLKITDLFKVDVGELIVGSDPARLPLRAIPVIGMIAAGNWREAIREPDTYISGIGVADDSFGLRISGDSMDQIAPEGSYVVIDPSQQTLLNGQLYAIMNDEGEATVKTFRSEPARLEPNSSNPEHKPLMLGARPITVIGRATMIIRPV